MKKNIAILIDSSTTINEEFARLNDIHMVPMQLIDSNGKTYADDGKEITQKQLFQEIANNRIFKSSVTNLGLLMAKVEELFEQYENVIFLPISPELSGNYNQAVNLIKPEFKNFFVVKNNTIAVMTEYAIHKLIDLLKTNKIEDAIVKIEKWMSVNETILFFPSTLEGLIKGGRISKFKGLLANILRKRPILVIKDGGIEKEDITSNFKSAVDKMFESIAKKFGSIKSVKKFAILVTETTNSEILDYIYTNIANKTNVKKSDIFVRQVPSVLLVHTWDGVFAIGAVGNNDE